ncbi:MAG: FimV/HubP family polar landmark protein [Pseudomonadales bacterium]
MNQWIRALAVAAAFSLSQAAYAVDFGQFQLKSYLNELLEIDIALTDAEGIATERLSVQLAPRVVYNRTGVAYTDQMATLRFAVRQGDDGNRYVSVTSTKPVNDLFLNFIAEVTWPGGRNVREFTFLLDQPVFDSDQPTQVAPVQRPATPSAPAPAAASEKPAAESEKPVARPAPTSRPAPARPARPVGPGEYRVRSGDYLWSTARNLRPDSSVSVNQTMLALQRLNPDAFIRGNINMVKAGHILKTPGLQDIRRVTAAQANREVAVHNQEFADYKAGRQLAQLDGRRRAAGRGGRSAGAEDGELRLVAPGAASGSGRGSSSGASAAVQDELASTKEALDEARRATVETQSLVTDLSGQVETLSELIRVRDEELAGLRRQLRRAKRDDAFELPSLDSLDFEDPETLAVLGGLLLLVVILVWALARRGGRRKKAQARGKSDWQPPSQASQVAADTDAGDADAADASTVNPPSLSAVEDEEVSDVEEDIANKLDLARAYIEMGDGDGARILLQEVIADGSAEDIAEANELLGKIS